MKQALNNDTTRYSTPEDLKTNARPIYDAYADNIAESFNYIKNDNFYYTIDKVLLKCLDYFQLPYTNLNNKSFNERILLEQWIICDMHFKISE